MGYTYDDMIKKAQQEGVYDKFTQQDLTAAQKSPEYGMALTGLLTTLGTAATDEQRVLTTEYINRLRNNYGVTDAAAGSAVSTSNRLIAPGQSGALDVTDANTYKTVLNDLVNQPAFSYDPTKDPAYAAYEKMYRREGERAVADTLAKAAAMTGGRPSSYAISAAQQTGNNYAAALADMIPTLRQNAYSEYLQNMNAKKDILSAVKGGLVTLDNLDLNDSEEEDLPYWKQPGYVDRFDRPKVEIENGSNESGTTEENGEIIVNSHTDDWVQIGDQKLDFAALFAMVNSGEVVEVYDPVKKTYMYYFANQDAGKNKNPMYN